MAPGVPNTETLLIPLFCSLTHAASCAQSEGRGRLAFLAHRSEAKFCRLIEMPVMPLPRKLPIHCDRLNTVRCELPPKVPETTCM